VTRVMRARWLLLAVVTSAVAASGSAFAAPDAGKDASTELTLDTVEEVDPVRAKAAVPKGPDVGAEDPGNRVWLAAAGVTFTAIIVLWLVRRRRSP
jgi:hypothetical protein